MNGRMEGEYEGERYRIAFEYSENDTIETKCIVTRVTGGEWRMWLIGYSILSPRDRHVKEIGRKVALTHALCDCPNRAFRTFIWSLYHGRKGGAK